MTAPILASSPAVETERKYRSQRSPSICPALWASQKMPSSSATNTSPAAAVSTRHTTA